MKEDYKKPRTVESSRMIVHFTEIRNKYKGPMDNGGGLNVGGGGGQGGGE